MLEQNYRSILKDELSKRCASNSHYSLRAFAKHLNLEPAHLSRVLNGKKNISSQTAKNISEILFIKEQDQNYFMSLVEYVTSKKQKDKERAFERIKKYAPQDESVQLQMEALKVLSEWYHVAILDAVFLNEPTFKAPSDFASYLGITTIEAKLAIERLIKLGLLEQTKTGFKKTHLKLKSTDDVPNLYLRKFHKQMIEKALLSLETQSVYERYVKGKTFTFSKKDIPQLKKIIDRFFEEVSQFIQTSKGKKDALYQLNTQLFDLRRKK